MKQLSFMRANPQSGRVNDMGEKVSKSGIVILKEFFGFKAGQTMKEFGEEMKALSLEEKNELISLAAAELGYNVIGEKAA